MSKETSLRASIIDGTFSSIMGAFANNYLAPFGLLLGATSFMIGLLTSIPQILSSVVQLWSTEITRLFGSRLKIIVPMVGAQAALLLIVPAVLFLPGRFQPLSYVMIIALSSMFASLGVPAWSSLMSDTVDKDKYGEYFAWRGKILGIISLASTLVMGFFLYIIHDKILGFSLLFLVSGICRIFSVVYLLKMDDIPVVESKREYFSYWAFIRRIKESNYARFVLYISLLNFAVTLTGPFAAVYMLRDLKINYLNFTLISSMSTLVSFLTLPLWGKLADKYGNAKVIKLSARFVPFFPVLWLASGNPYYFMLLNCIAGYVWGGLTVGTTNFIFDAASPEVRTRCVAYFNFTNGFFIFLGASLGGYLSSRLPLLGFSSNILVLFCIGGLARALVNFFMLDSFKEVRKVSHISDTGIFYIIMGVSSENGLFRKSFTRK